ncbi:MAG: hypothetical protein KDH09_04435, partial [Chrysiogenetes bacterium]|nr:hypothetical protein [Chrysiogenetes bacterium]
MSSAPHLLRFAAIVTLLVPVCFAPLRTLASDNVSNTPNNVSVLPLVVSGNQVPTLGGQSLLGLTAFRCAAGKTTPVVFQVDEINSQNRVVSGDALPEVSADEQPGLIDDNDQIVFMQRDLGERCGEEQLGRARGKLVELEASGGSLKDKAYLYLLSAERGHVPSSSAVRFDKSRQTISTPAYEMTYSIEHPHMLTSFILHELRLRENKNVLDRMNVLMDAKALGALVQLHM